MEVPNNEQPDNVEKIEENTIEEIEEGKIYECTQDFSAFVKKGDRIEIVKKTKKATRYRVFNENGIKGDIEYTLKRGIEENFKYNFKEAEKKQERAGSVIEAGQRVEELKNQGKEKTVKIKDAGAERDDILEATNGEKAIEDTAEKIINEYEGRFNIPEIVPLDNLNEQELNEKLKEVDEYILQEGIDLAHFNDGDYSDEQIKIIKYREELLRKKSELNIDQKKKNEKQPINETDKQETEGDENIFNSVYNEYKDKNFGLEGYVGLWRVKNASKGRFELENLDDKTIKTIGAEDLYASIKKFDLDFLQKQKENIQSLRGLTEEEKEEKLSGVDEKIINLEKELSELKAKDVIPEEKVKKKYEMREILLKLRDVLDLYKKRGDLIGKLSGKRDKNIQRDIDQCNENIEKYYNDLIEIENLEDMIGPREFNMLLEIEDRVIKRGMAKDKKVEKEGDADIVDELDQKLKKRSALIQQVLNFKKRDDIDENEIAAGQTTIGALSDEIFNLHRKISEMKLKDLSDDEKKVLIKADRLIKSGKLNYGKITEMPKSDIFGLGNDFKKVGEILQATPETSADTKHGIQKNIEKKIEFLKKQYEIANSSKDPQFKLNANHIKMELKNFGVEVEPETIEKRIKFLEDQYEIANSSKDPESISRAHELNKEIESLKAQVILDSKPASKLEEITDLEGFDMPSFAVQNEKIPKTAEDIQKNLIKLFESHQNKGIDAVDLVSNAIEFCQLNKLDDEGLVLTEIQLLFEMDKIDEAKLEKARAENEKLSSLEIKSLFSSLIDKSEELAKGEPIKEKGEQKEEEKTAEKLHEFNIGDTVIVERSDGTVDLVGWFVHSIHPDGKITVIKPDEKDRNKDVVKTLDSEELASWQEKYKADKRDEFQEIPDYKDDKEIGNMSIDQLSEEKDKVSAYLNVLLKDGRTQSEEFEKYNAYLSFLMNALEKISKKPKIEIVSRETRENFEVISMAEAIKMARKRSEEIDSFMENSGFNMVLEKDAETLNDVEISEEVIVAKEKAGKGKKLTTADFRALQRRLENVAITTTTSAVADTAKMTLLHAYGKYPTQMEMLKERAAYLHDINESLRVTIQSLDAAEIYRKKEKDERSLLSKIGRAFGRGGKKEKKSESVEGTEANCKLSEGDMDRLKKAKNIGEIKPIIEKIGEDIEAIKSNDDVKDATKDTLSQTLEAMKTLSSLNKEGRKKKLKALKENIDKISGEDFDNNLKNYFKSLFDKIDEFSPDDSEEERENGGNEPQAEGSQNAKKKRGFWDKLLRRNKETGNNDEMQGTGEDENDLVIVRPSGKLDRHKKGEPVRNGKLPKINKPTRDAILNKLDEMEDKTKVAEGEFKKDDIVYVKRGGVLYERRVTAIKNGIVTVGPVDDKEQTIILEYFNADGLAKWQEEHKNYVKEKREKEKKELDDIFSKSEINKVKNVKNDESLVKIIQNQESMLGSTYNKKFGSSAVAKYYQEFLHAILKCYDVNSKKINLDKFPKLDVDFLAGEEDYNKNADNYFAAVFEKLGAKTEEVNKKDNGKGSDKKPPEPPVEPLMADRGVDRGEEKDISISSGFKEMAKDISENIAKEEGEVDKKIRTAIANKNEKEVEKLKKEYFNKFEETWSDSDPKRYKKTYHIKNELKNNLKNFDLASLETFHGALLESGEAATIGASFNKELLEHYKIEKVVDLDKIRSLTVKEVREAVESVYRDMKQKEEKAKRKEEMASRPEVTI